MKFEFQKAIETIDMGDYLEAYRGRIVYVWVNPPRAKRAERDALVHAMRRWVIQTVTPIEAETKHLAPKSRLARVIERLKKPVSPKQPSELSILQQKMFEWIADLWNQSPDPDPEKHWSAEEIRVINENDQTLYQWLTQKSLLMIEGYRADVKKA